jgi:hypothetical protein
MSERTFRAVIAAVLVGALALALLVVLALVPRPAAPEPTPPATTGAPTLIPTLSSGPTATATPAPPPTPTPTPSAWADASLAGVGAVPRGSESGRAFVLTLTELGADSIPDAPGSFEVTLVDGAGDASTVEFAGTPTSDAPGSLGLTVRLGAPNVLMVSIVASDRYNVEPITIRGLSLRAAPSAALGQIDLQFGEFSGSLAGGTTGGDALPVGTVVEAP